MRIAVLADIGHSVYHVGDEAIAHATRHELTRRGHTVVMLTRSVTHTRAHFGEVEAERGGEFPHASSLRTRRAREMVQSALTGEELDADAQRTIQLVAECEAVHVAGGGSLTSTYGWLLSERTALAGVGSALRKRVTLSGQSLGPALDGQDQDDLARMFDDMTLAGLRDEESARRAREIAPGATDRIHAVLDDATFFESDPPSPGADAVSAPSAAGTIAVTLSPDLVGAFGGDPAYPAIAAFLLSVVRATGLPISFVPHMGTSGGADGDAAIHARVAELLPHDVAEILPLMTATDSARAVRDAALIITSRFHPLVFGIRDGIPFVPLPATNYAAARMRGVASNWGLDGYVVAAPAMLEDHAADLVSAIWRERSSVHDHVATVRPALLTRSTAWWDAVAGAPYGVPTDLAATSPRLAAPDVVKRMAEPHEVFLRTAMWAEQTAVENDRLRSDLEMANNELAPWRSIKRMPGASIVGRMWRGITHGR